MAGHSKWANIQHRKGRQDAVRSKMFSKLAKEITVAAKMGDPDPDKNPRLRMAVKEAKTKSVPKDVIDRAINKASAQDGENYEEIRYEGYGPAGVAVIVEAMTDNKNRTASTVPRLPNLAAIWPKLVRCPSCLNAKALWLIPPPLVMRTRSLKPQLKRAQKTWKAQMMATRFTVNLPI